MALLELIDVLSVARKNSKMGWDMWNSMPLDPRLTEVFFSRRTTTPSALGDIPDGMLAHWLCIRLGSCRIPLEDRIVADNSPLGRPNHGAPLLSDDNMSIITKFYQNPILFQSQQWSSCGQRTRPVGARLPAGQCISDSYMILILV